MHGCGHVPTGETRVHVDAEKALNDDSEAFHIRFGIYDASPRISEILPRPARSSTVSAGYEAQAQVTDPKAIVPAVEATDSVGSALGASPSRRRRDLLAGHCLRYYGPMNQHFNDGRRNRKDTRGIWSTLLRRQPPEWLLSAIAHAHQAASPHLTKQITPAVLSTMIPRHVSKLSSHHSGDRSRPRSM